MVDLAVEEVFTVSKIISSIARVSAMQAHETCLPLILLETELFSSRDCIQKHLLT